MRVRLPDGTRLFVDIDGAVLVPAGATMRRRPVLVAVHGGPGADHSTFKPHLDPLTKLAQVIYVDLRGQGRSDPSTPHEWNLAQWAADLAALCGVLGLDRPIVLADSAGTYVALHLAFDHPDVAGGFVLLSASARSRPDRSAAVFERLGGPKAAESARAFWNAPNAANRAAFLRWCRPHYGKVSGRIGEESTRIESRPEVFEHFVAERARYDVLDRLGALTVPVLVVNGSDDPVTTIDDARDLVAALPPGRGRLIELEGRGHGLLAEDPTGTRAAIARFLADPERAVRPVNPS